MQTGCRSVAGRRSSARRQAWLTSAVALGVLSGGSAQAQGSEPVQAPNAADTRVFTLTPSLGLQGAFTDNVRLTQDNRESDFITRVYGAVDAELNGVRAQGTLRAQASYDFYADSDDLNGWSAQGFGVGTYDLIQDVLSLDADAGVTNGNISTFGSSAIDRSGIDGRVQLTTLGFGPRLTTTLGEVADLDASARIASVSYARADSSNVAGLPDDATIFDAAINLDTADRISNVQLSLGANYEEDDRDFSAYGALLSGYFKVAPSLRLIARAGYDNIQDSTNLDIDAPAWNLGLEYHPSESILFSAEGGQRYDEPTWAAQASVAVTSRFYLTASYSERVEPDQNRISNDFEDFVAQQGVAATPLTPDQFTINGNLYNTSSLNKQAQLHAIYTWPTRSLGVSVTWNDRYFYANQANDRTLTSSATYSQQLRPDLNAELGGDYAETYDSPVYGESRSYGLWARLAYSLNPTLQLAGGYAYSNSEADLPREKIQENIIFASILKSF